MSATVHRRPARARPDLVVYGQLGVAAVRQVLVALREKRTSCEFEAVLPPRWADAAPMPAWFLEISPAGSVPALRDRSVGTEGAAGTLVETDVILDYLELKLPTPPLLPRHPFARGKALWFAHFAEATLGPVVEACWPRGPAARESAGRAELAAWLDFLNREVGVREFLVGDAFSVADLAICCQLINLRPADIDVDPQRWPALSDYLVRMLRRRSLRTVWDEEAALLSGALSER